VINRFGFNNEGMDAIGDRLTAAERSLPIGLNLGANKDSTDRAADFARVLRRCGPHVEFATVNVSSPNTEKLRDLQGREALTSLLAGVMQARAELNHPIPIFLKIAPDLTDDELSEIAEVSEAANIEAIIATNTTLSRDGLTDPQKGEMGGLSGAPLFEKSTRVLAKLSAQTDLPLIGVGGIATGEQAFQKIAAGASAVQLYSAMVYGGLSLAAKIANDLDALMQAKGFDTIDALKGSGRDRWL
jgi:dihydroorotate dehydrogenase